MEEIKRSRKSKIKKRPEDWEQLKVELAKELGLWPKVKNNGWAGLSAEESGRLGGVFAARKGRLQEDGQEHMLLDDVLEYGTAKEGANTASLAEKNMEGEQ